MRNSLGLFAVFIIGTLISVYSGLDFLLVITDYSDMVLIALLFTISLSIGRDPHINDIKKITGIKVLLAPISVIMGSYIGVILVGNMIPHISFFDSLAIASGFGYYSLSSVIIADVKGEALGILALVSNLMREMITILSAPLIAKFFNKLAPIAAGGATSMDTTLPVIIRYSGKEFTLIAIINGLVLTLLVPVLVGIFVQF